ncbi:uncharacterized protein B0H18DRAFT_1055045, partial [Fomitopsis serialis]|uniref:uncharacterized protein n=1 Tax=Fomitopsis serialis TaxID=139415 RepID=UPI002007B015
MCELLPSEPAPVSALHVAGSLPLVVFVLGGLGPSRAHRWLDPPLFWPPPPPGTHPTAPSRTSMSATRAPSSAPSSPLPSATHRTTRPASTCSSPRPTPPRAPPCPTPPRSTNRPPRAQATQAQGKRGSARSRPRLSRCHRLQCRARVH